MSKPRDYHWKQCAFCGETDNLDILRDENGRWAVVCKSCGASGPDSAYIPVAVRKWNVRPEIDRLTGELHNTIAKFPEAMREVK